MITIRVATDFSMYPGGRFIEKGPNSGEEFRVELLEPIFLETNNNVILVDLDGTAGYATSFLEEAFGGLARIYGIDQVLKRIKIKSDERPIHVGEIDSYIKEANDKK